MRKRLLLFLIPCLLSFPGFSKEAFQPPLDLIIDESFNEVPLEQAFKKIHRKYHIFFSYTKEIVAPYTVNVVIDKEPLKEAMGLLLAGTDLTYEILQQKFILIKRVNPPPSKVPFICGWVTDQNNGSHLPYATLKLLGTPHGTVCKKDGSFYFSGKYPLSTLVEISYLGFKKMQITFGELLKRDCQPIALEREEISVEAITISEYLTDGISQRGMAIRLQPEKIRTLPGLTETDLFQLAQYIPGISSSEESASGIEIRGGSPDQTLVTLDGIPLYKTGHFFDMISSLNPAGISEAQIYRSGYDATEAGRVSGLIQLSQGNEVPEKQERGINLNLTHAGFNFKTPFNKGKTGLFLSGRSSIVDHINSPTFSRLERRVFQNTRIGAQIEEAEDGNEQFDFENTFRFSDWNAKLIHQPNKNHTFSLVQHISRNDITYWSEWLQQDYGAWDSVYQRNLGLGLHWDYDNHKKLKVHTDLTISDYRSNYEFNFSSPIRDLTYEELDQTNSLVDIRFTHEYTWKHKSRNEWKLGAQGVLQEARYSLFYDNLDMEAPEEDPFTQPSILASLYGYRRHYRDRWWLETSLRTTLHTLSENLYFDPRVSFDYLLTPNLHLKAHAGIYHQFVNQLIQWDFTYYWINQPIWIMSDKNNVPVITSLQSFVGLKYDKKGWLVDVEAYRKRNIGLTSRNTAFLEADDEFFIYGDSFTTGLDVLVKKRWRKVRAWASYTLSKTNFEFDDFQDERFPAPLDQRHNLSLTSIMDLNQWHFSLAWNYRSGRPFTDVIGEVDSLVQANGEEYWVNIPVFDAPNRARLADFHRVDFSVFYELISKRHSNRKLSFGLSILNILNRENELSRQYFRDYFDRDTPANERGLNRVDRVSLSRVPNFSVRFRW